MKEDVRITNEFDGGMGRVAASIDLVSGPYYTTTMKHPLRQAQRTVGIWRGEGEEKAVLWLGYYRISTRRATKYFWGLTPDILDLVVDAAHRRGSQWGVVLIEGDHRKGYYVRGDDVQAARQWLSTGPDGEYKVNQADLPKMNAQRFFSLRKLFELLGFEVAREQ
jgi:hypothetical protein